MRPSLRFTMLGLALAGLTSACGTTVPQGRSVPVAGDGLTSSVQSPSGLGTSEVAESDRASAPLGGAGAAPGTAGVPATGRSGGGSGSSSSSGATGDVRTSGQRVSAPLKIGIIYLSDGGAAQSLGLNQGVSDYTPEQVARGLVKGFNAQGGLNGRRLEAYYAPWSTSSNDYSSDAAAICAKFSQDTPVPVVVDLGVGNLGGLPECLASKGIVHLSTGFETDVQGMRALPLHVNTAFLSIDRTYLDTVDRLAAVRYLTRSTKLGVIREECPDNVRTYDRVLLPHLRRVLGQTPLLVTSRCSNGVSQASGASADVSNAVLRFNSSGVTRVLFVSHYESIVLLLFSNAAENQGYRPGYALSSYAGAAPVSASLPPGQLPGLHGAGWRPLLDTSDVTFTSASERRCQAVFRAGGNTAKLPNDQGAVGVSCAPMLVLERLLQITSGAFTRDVVRAAMDRVGSSLELPTVHGGRSILTAERRDMPSQGQAFAYVAACSCLRYTGQPATLG